MRLRTRNWTAKRMSKDFAGAGGKILVVTGEVETTSRNQSLRLSKAEPQGINPNILLLHLSVTASGIGNDIVLWKPVEHSETDSVDRYVEVAISGDCDNVTTVITEVPS